MKRIVIISIIINLFFTATAFSAANDKATKEECKQKCMEVASIVNKKGEQAAIDAVMAKGSPFVWKDTYVFIVDINGITRAHPAAPQFIGKSLMHLKDVDGVMFMQEFVDIGIEDGEGWVNYKWPKKGDPDKVPYPKTSFVVKAKDLVIGAGIYLE